MDGDMVVRLGGRGKKKKRLPGSRNQVLLLRALGMISRIHVFKVQPLSFLVALEGFAETDMALSFQH